MMRAGNIGPPSRRSAVCVRAQQAAAPAAPRRAVVQWALAGALAAALGGAAAPAGARDYQEALAA